MGSLSVWHWLIVLAIVVLVFGTGKLKNMGKDLGGAIKGFKEGMREADDKPADQTAAKEIPQQQTAEAKQADTIDVDAKEKPLGVSPQYRDRFPLNQEDRGSAARTAAFLSL